LASCGGDDVIITQPKKAKPTPFLTPPTENPVPSGRLMHVLILGVKWGFGAITLVPDMLEGQARDLSTREII